MVDYYKLLGIQQDADEATIRDAIKKTRRTWNNRTNNPDAAVRAEAERHVAEIKDAESILLDNAKRQQYDVQLRTAPPAPSQPTGGPAEDEDWETEFWNAMERDVPDLAAEIAERALRANQKSGMAWMLFGEAKRRCGDTQQGLNSLQRALMYLTAPADIAFCNRQIGFAYWLADDDNNALKAFRSASHADPSNSEFHRFISNIYRDHEMYSDALPEAETAFKMDPKNNDTRLEYFLVLEGAMRKAMAYNRDTGKNLIINKVQLDYVNAQLKKMAQTIPEGKDKAKCTSKMDAIVKIVVDAERSYRTLFSGTHYGYEDNYNKSNSSTRASGMH